tara:strand:- start:7993 stop:8445 length:453 start_codon:yes stop_codon:yes gene_type:complete
MEKRINKALYIAVFSIIIIQIIYYLIIHISEIEYFRYSLKYFTPDFINKYKIEYLIISYEILLLCNLFVLRIRYVLRLLVTYYIFNILSIIYFLMDSYFYGCGCELFFKTTNFTSLFFFSVIPFAITVCTLINIEKSILSKKILAFIKHS